MRQHRLCAFIAPQLARGGRYWQPQIKGLPKGRIPVLLKHCKRLLSGAVRKRNESNQTFLTFLQSAKSPHFSGVFCRHAHVVTGKSGSLSGSPACKRLSRPRGLGLSSLHALQYRQQPRARAVCSFVLIGFFRLLHTAPQLALHLSRGKAAVRYRSGSAARTRHFGAFACAALAPAKPHS